MRHEELRQVAIDYLAKVFKGESVPRYDPHIIEAAVKVVLSYDPTPDDALMPVETKATE